ncbi:MAG: glutathione S-transferase N-terminal domain-containing protein [Alphaproteobacteria bacterium]|nr:glutathione S-transferase N-terminal domain-containing protein [Alphaproteobacteria bacterium]
MHTLFSFPFSCALAVELELTRHGLPYEVRHVTRGRATRVDGEAFAEVNPKRKVPVLVLPDGERLTEIVGILTHLDTVHGPDRTAAERRRVLEDVAFVATELHQAVLGPLFDPSAPDATRADVVERLLPPLVDILETRVAAGWIGATRGPADAYLLWGLLLLRHGAKGTTDRPHLDAFVARHLDEPDVQRVLARARRTLG